MIAVIYVINAILALIVLRYEFYSHSDQTIIVTSSLLALLIAINLIIGLLLQLWKKHFHHFYLCGLLLLITTLASLFHW